jgi:predicted transcriptional regulator YheO
MHPTDQDFLLDTIARFSKAVAAAIGNHCEVVVHDLRRPESSIIAITNGHITGRKVGDTLDALGLELLKNPPPTDLLNYRAKTKDGKTLRSSSVFLRDTDGRVFGALCINLDISGLIQAQEWLQEAIGQANNTIKEGFEHSIDEILETLLEGAIATIGKAPSELTRDDKIAIVSYLDAKGAFLIRYSVERVAKQLNLTKYTIYNYLEKIKQGAHQRAGRAGTLAADVLLSRAAGTDGTAQTAPLPSPRSLKRRRKALPEREHTS